MGLNTIYMSNAYDVGKHPAFWAGVILHQALHSRGFVHDSAKEELNYSSFPVKAGECLQELEESISGKPQNEGRIPLVDRWHDDFICPVRAYIDNSLPFEIHKLDVKLVQTVADDRVSGTCFQEDKFYGHDSLKSIGFNDNISRLIKKQKVM